MLNGYAFTNPSPMSGGERWYCSGRIRWKCSVCLHVNDDYELVCISHEHAHDPPIYEITSDGLYSLMIRTSSGKKLLMYDKYTYSAPKPLLTRCKIRSFKCTDRGHVRCNKYIHVNDELTVVAEFSYHNHKPPTYIKMLNGDYVKC
ncbi:unnamed protein product [Euphydryas editha]|nr:unnamed protein product [Euphydryas editha]